MIDTLGDRMKDYETISRTRLPRRSWFVIRLDGKSFHTFTAGLRRPYDRRIMDAMDDTTHRLCKESEGAVFAYTQSDEISLVFGPGGRNSQPWFDGQVQKLVSVTASIATLEFNLNWRAYAHDEVIAKRRAYFDARVFSLPDVSEVANYLIWRQQDAVRNSISMAGQAKFSHKELQGVKSGKIQDMLWTEHRINWSEYPPRFKRGAQVVRRQRIEPITFINAKMNAEETIDAIRNPWEIEEADQYVHGLLVDTLNEAAK